MLKKKVKESKIDIKIVDFLDIDTSLISFQKPKKNNHNGSQIGILYDGEIMYVRYEGLSQFGMREKYDHEGNFLGINMQINCDGAYLLKAQELDQFFYGCFLNRTMGS